MSSHDLYELIELRVKTTFNAVFIQIRIGDTVCSCCTAMSEMIECDGFWEGRKTDDNVDLEGDIDIESSWSCVNSECRLMLSLQNVGKYVMFHMILNFWKILFFFLVGI